MSSPAISIRRATLADAPLLAELNRHVHEPHRLAEPDLYRATDARDLEVRYRERLADPDVVVFIASANEPLGYAVAVQTRLPENPFSPARERLLLDELAVVREQRRLGVGRALMQAAEQTAADLGFRSVQLDVRAFNAAALSFYQALGYAPVQLRLERRSRSA